MIDSTNPSELRGKKLVDPEGGEIGEVRDVYLNHRTDQPEFALVDSGLLGRKATLVPLAGASLEGPRLWVSVEKAQVSDAPTLDPEDEISAEQEAELYHHYGIDPAAAAANSGEQHEAQASATAAPENEPAQAKSEEVNATDPGADPSTHVDTPRVAEGGGESEQGLPRLRRYVVTDEIDVKVPVQREEVRVEPPDSSGGRSQ